MDLLRQNNGVFDVRLMPDDAAILALALKQAGDGGDAHLYRYITAIEAMQSTFELCALLGYQVWGSLPQDAGPEAVRGGPLADEVPPGAMRLYERMSAKFGEEVGTIFEETLGWVPREAKKRKAKPPAADKAKEESGEGAGDGGEETGGDGDEAASPLPTAAD